jgi:hypothetical protein
MDKHTQGPLTRGYYRPTDRFRQIEEHVAVMRESDQSLVAVCGPTGDPASEADALLYAAAPSLLEAAQAAVAALSQNATFPADVAYATNCLRAAIASATSRE